MERGPYSYCTVEYTMERLVMMQERPNGLSGNLTFFTSECNSRDIAEATKYGLLLLVTER